MKRCPYCGAQLADNATYCGVCRNNIAVVYQNQGSASVPPGNQYAYRNNQGYPVNSQNPAYVPPQGQYVYQNNQGYPVNSQNPGYGTYPAPQPAAADSQSGLKTAIKVFMIIACVLNGIFAVISLAWTIPMTVSVFHCLRDGRPIGTGMKVCSLIFVSLISGILLLCLNDKENVQYY